MLSRIKKVRQNFIFEWLTASELDNNYFEIELSKDGKNYSSIDKVESLGDSFVNQHYHAEYPVDGQGLFYFRLKQTDYDGKFAYSDIQIISISELNEISLQSTLVNQEIIVKTSEGLNEDLSFMIYDLSGRLFQYEKNFSTDEAFTIDVSKLHQGHYLIQILVGNNQVTKRFYKI